MTKDQMQTYKWLDAQEVKPRPLQIVSTFEKSIQKRLNQKMLDFLNKF